MWKPEFDLWFYFLQIWVSFQTFLPFWLISKTFKIIRCKCGLIDPMFTVARPRQTGTTLIPQSPSIKFNSPLLVETTNTFYCRLLWIIQSLGSTLLHDTQVLMPRAVQKPFFELDTIYFNFEVSDLRYTIPRIKK